MEDKFNLDIFRSILFTDLRPWMNREIPKVKYRQALNEIKPIHFSFDPLYKLNFIKPLGEMRKYYCQIIQDETIKFLNNFHEDTKNISVNEQKLMVYKIINQRLPQFFKDTDTVIKEKGFSYDIIKPENIHLNTNETMCNETFVFQFMKFNLIYIFLEVQKQFPTLLKQDLLELEEIHQVYFNEFPKDYNFISQNELVILEETPKISNIKEIEGIEEKFTPQLRDFRNDKPKLLKFETLIKKPNLFAQFEEQLYANKIIDLQTTFIPKSIEINELAKIYHILIKKGYFNKKKFSPPGDISTTDIRKFLDYRYSVLSDQQFRKFSNNPELVSEYQAQNYWLDKLSVCS